MSRNLIYMSRNFAMPCYKVYYKSFMAIGWIIQMQEMRSANRVNQVVMQDLGVRI